MQYAAERGEKFLSPLSVAPYPSTGVLFHNDPIFFGLPFLFFPLVPPLPPPCLSVSNLGKMPSFKAICSPSPKYPAR